MWSLELMTRLPAEMKPVLIPRNILQFGHFWPFLAAFFGVLCHLYA